MSTDGCILGFVSDAWIASHGTWYDTHIGGTPIWPDDLDVVIPPCPRCHAQRVLVLQAYAPHQHHSQRVIFLFACNSIVCAADTDSWWAVRVCRFADDATSKHAPPEGDDRTSDDVVHPDLGREIDWDTDSASERSSQSDLADHLALLSLELELAHAKKEATNVAGLASRRASSKPAKRERHGVSEHPQESVGGQAGTDHSFPAVRAPCEAYFVEVDTEPSATKPLVDESSVDTLLQKYIQEEKSRAASGTTESWAVEKEDDESHAHRNYEQFVERIARAPSQILRYKFGGQPIWPKHPFPEFDPIACCDCGSPLTFELQVLATCLHYLQPDKSVPDHQAHAGMNFASVAVFTCADDCTIAKTIADNGQFKVISQTVRIQLDDW